MGKPVPVATGPRPPVITSRSRQRSAALRCHVHRPEMRRASGPRSAIAPYFRHERFVHASVYQGVAALSRVPLFAGPDGRACVADARPRGNCSGRAGDARQGRCGGHAQRNHQRLLARHRQPRGRQHLYFPGPSERCCGDHRSGRPASRHPDPGRGHRQYAERNLWRWRCR